MKIYQLIHSEVPEVYAEPEGLLNFNIVSYNEQYYLQAQSARERNNLETGGKRGFNKLGASFSTEENTQNLLVHIIQ